jgi:uncharacterized membrane protein
MYTKNWKLYFVTLALLLLTREDVALIFFFVGFYIFYSRESLRAGMATMIITLLYYFIVTRFIMPHDSSYNYDYYFEKMQIEHRSLFESILITAFTNPMYIVRYALTERKVLYFFQLILPLIGLPLLCGRKVFLFFYGFIVTVLVSRGAVFDISYQYSTFLYPFFFALLPGAVKSVGSLRIVKFFNLDANRLKIAVVVALLASSVAVSYNFGVFYENSSFRAGHSRFERNPDDSKKRRYEVIKELQKIIPDNASLTATMFVGAHFAARDHIYRFHNLKPTDYYLLLNRDLKSDKIKNQYKDFMKMKKYDLIFKKSGLKLYIKKSLNKGRYQVILKDKTEDKHKDKDK